MVLGLQGGGVGFVVLSAFLTVILPPPAAYFYLVWKNKKMDQDGGESPCVQ